MTKAAYLFTHDLRLSDNQSLSAAIESSDELSIIFILDPNWFRPTNYHQKPMGSHRWRFLKASLLDISKRLNFYGQNLNILIGNPVIELHRFIEANDVARLYLTKQFGSYEVELIDHLQVLNPGLHIQEFWQSTLFTRSELDFSSVSLSSFTQFKNTTKHLSKHVKPPEGLPSSLIKSSNLCDEKNFESKLALFEKQFVTMSSSSALDEKFTGGETAGNTHLHHYFCTHNASSYKQTRNELDGWENSTKFSPYLALGNLSAKQIWYSVTNYESLSGANESTYWIRFELLWREYFQWLLYRYGKAFFRFSGLANKAPLTSFYSQRFKLWCSGNTPYPLVNACMRELNETGYMSNRGRQITASCLVNELAVDWRYGAAYFQQQLVDFDIACNWGNWQYIAGVGVDPRGGRHFDIDKQTAMYDPDSEFVNKWAEGVGITTSDHVDIDDWPIEQKK